MNRFRRSGLVLSLNVGKFHMSWGFRRRPHPVPRRPFWLQRHSTSGFRLWLFGKPMIYVGYEGFVPPSPAPGTRAE